MHGLNINVWDVHNTMLITKLMQYVACKQSVSQNIWVNSSDYTVLMVFMCNFFVVFVKIISDSEFSCLSVHQ